jgi:hypothetical protein
MKVAKKHGVKRLRQLGQENGPAQVDGNIRAVRLSADQGSGAMSVQATPRRSQARPRS